MAEQVSLIRAHLLGKITYIWDWSTSTVVTISSLLNNSRMQGSVAGFIYLIAIYAMFLKFTSVIQRSPQYGSTITQSRILVMNTD